MPLEPASHGLLARAPEYEPLRAFSQDGRYWDRVPQQLIREGALAEFLPAVEVEEDERGKYARFFRTPGEQNCLARSRPVGRHGIPPVQLARLSAALEAFKQKALVPGTQPQNRDLIERFRLPDIARDPELYRLAGPWWNRRLEILWGCERRRDSSLPAAAAASKLRGDRWYTLRRLLTAFLLLLLILLPAWWLVCHWDWLHSHRVQAAGQDAVPRDAVKTKPPPANPPPKNVARNPARPGAPEAKAAAACQIVLLEQGQPDLEGVAEVTLEVYTASKPPRAVPVETWQADAAKILSGDRLRVRLKAGEHLIKAVILDENGKTVVLSALVTVVPDKTVTTPGKVTVRQK